MYQNRISLMGFTGKDAEARTTKNQTAYAVLSLATKISYKDKKSGEYVSHTEWHRIVVWGKLGEFASTLKKGTHLLVESFDRLSRREARRAHRLFDDLIDTGYSKSFESLGVRHGHVSARNPLYRSVEIIEGSLLRRRLKNPPLAAPIDPGGLVVQDLPGHDPAEVARQIAGHHAVLIEAVKAGHDTGLEVVLQARSGRNFPGGSPGVNWKASTGRPGRWTRGSGDG